MTQYRVLTLEENMIAEDLEQLLNDAASEGWKFIGSDLPWIYLKRWESRQALPDGTRELPPKNW